MLMPATVYGMFAPRAPAERLPLRDTLRVAKAYNHLAHTRRLYSVDRNDLRPPSLTGLGPCAGTEGIHEQGKRPASWDELTKSRKPIGRERCWIA
jgi:hypothetical protein